MGSWEKLWEEPFAKLIQALESGLGGTVRHAKEHPNNTRGATDYFVYPTWSAELDGLPVEVEMREIPLSVQLLDMADNVEFLRISLHHVNASPRVVISHEGWPQRVSKVIWSTFEFQVGSAEFDRKYFLASKPNADLGWLRNTDAQELISSVEPFTEFRAAKTGLAWTLEIDKPELLDAGRVTRVATHLRKLAELLPPSGAE